MHLALAATVSRQLQAIITSEYLRANIVVPLVNMAWNLQPIEKRTCEELDSYITAHLDNALERNWKSWVVTVASHDLGTLDYVKTEDSTLTTLIEDTIYQVTDSVTWRLSRVFQRFGVLAPGVHRDFDCQLHPAKFAEVLSAIKDSNGDVNRYQGRYEPPMVRQNIIDFATKLVQRAADHSCNRNGGTTLCVSRSNVAKPPYLNANKEFNALKSLLCRSLANEGMEFRFSLSRYAIVAMVAAGCDCDTVTLPVFERVFSWERERERREADAVGMPMPDIRVDPADQIALAMSVFSWGHGGVSSVDSEARECGLTLTFTGNGAAAKLQERGDDKVAFNELKVRGHINYVPESTQWALKIDARIDTGDVSILWSACHV